MLAQLDSLYHIIHRSGKQNSAQPAPCAVISLYQVPHTSGSCKISRASHTAAHSAIVPQSSTRSHVLEPSSGFFAEQRVERHRRQHIDHRVIPKRRCKIQPQQGKQCARQPAPRTGHAGKMLQRAAPAKDGCRQIRSCKQRCKHGKAVKALPDPPTHQPL